MVVVADIVTLARPASVCADGCKVRFGNDDRDGNLGFDAMQVLLLEYDVNTAPFTADVHACVPPLPWSVSHADRAAPYRRDLRHICVCSVDPPGCKDIDDALHARELPNGNLEVCLLPQNPVWFEINLCNCACRGLHACLDFDCIRTTRR